MKPFHECMNEYRKQIKVGIIQEAYRGLMEYIMDLRVHLQKKYPDHFVSGRLYYGYMDMTYFAFTPDSIKRNKLKIAIVFVHETFRFEAWLAGANKQIQTRYWNLAKESGWKKYRIPLSTKGVDSIVECILVENPHFSDLDALTKRIETETLKFIKDVESFLSKHPD